MNRLSLLIPILSINHCHSVSEYCLGILLMNVLDWKKEIHITKQTVSAITVRVTVV